MNADALQSALADIRRELGGLSVPRELLARLLLENDEEAFGIVTEFDPAAAGRIRGVVERVNALTHEPVEFRLAIRHRDRAAQIAARTVHQGRTRFDFGWEFDRVLMHPLWGWAVLAAVLYLVFYQFVGVFGAGTVVNFLENAVFGRYLNPFFTRFFETLLPWRTASDLFVGEYGVLTLGMRYAVSLILPIVTFFFIAFSIVEDTGYLPRLAMLLDGFFKRIGLSGRAVIPMVLGLGCVTMATLVTRTLPTRRERVIATVLLSLAVPCSAQLGVILGLLSMYPKALLLWALTILIIFFVTGSALSRMMPGSAPSFYMELPPLRGPLLSNVLMKTWTRLRWYFWEVLPLFLAASVIIWAGRLIGAFDAVCRVLTGPLRAVGLPVETAPAFLFGFFRRDYGAAGLFDLGRRGVLGAEQLFVSCVALTLFVPCIAQFLVNLKERGWRVGGGISAFTLAFAYAAAFAAHRLAVAAGIFG